MDSSEWIYWLALLVITSMVTALFVFDPLLRKYQEWKLKREFWLRDQRDNRY